MDENVRHRGQQSHDTGFFRQKRAKSARVRLELNAIADHILRVPCSAEEQSLLLRQEEQRGPQQRYEH